ncbi:hypothetical protein IAI18_17965 [Acetobacteraceae bacterium H6797]|nr:hypothetical protein [Acetobacteraceae bacterium H6797]
MILLWLGLAFTLLTAGGAVALMVWHAMAVRVAHKAVPGRACLILPLAAPEIPTALFEALARQSLRPARLILAIEAEETAFAEALRLATADLPFPVSFALAPPAQRCSQKCANLIAAFALVTPEDEAIVMIDGDILPQPWWLSSLASPIFAGSHDMVNGYRWQEPEGGGAMAQAVAWLERSFAQLPNRQWAGVLWGGSLAFSPEALRRLDLPTRLATAFSDDLTIADAARALRLKLLCRRALLLPTRLGEGAWRFMRRQMAILRLHQPGHYRLAVAWLLADGLGWLAILALLSHSTIAWVALGLLYAGRLLRWALAQRLARIIGVPDTASNRLGQLLPVLAAPLMPWLWLALLLSARARGLMRWRHITYEIAGPAEVTVIERSSSRG